MLQQIGRANFAIQNQIEGLTVEKAKLHSQAINQAKKENEKLSGIILKEKEELLRKVREARNKKSQLSYQLQLCEQEIRSLDERLNLVNQRGSEIDLMREQSHSKQRPQSGKTSSENFNSFHIDESEKIVDHAQRYLVEHILRGTDGSNTLIDPAQEAIDKIRESQNVYIENEIKCIMFVVLRLQKMKSKVVQWRKDLEVYKKLHLQVSIFGDLLSL